MVYTITPTREYTKPQWNESEGRFFNSNAELEEYARDKNLEIRYAPSSRRKSRHRTTYMYCRPLGKTLEVRHMRSVEAIARDIQKKHPEYSEEKCFHKAEKIANGKEGKKNEQ